MVTKAQESAPDVREVDSNAPFQSVKDAVSLFGDAGSPASASTALAKKKAEEVKFARVNVTLYLQY